ncbi:hypothetical protein ABEB36_015146 [Hypothenemus hampei]|uniref:Uncharacterized protein n=1 Tax=Hypothenemus hampei TaxID=57062 RepID=A0ABD1E0U5_HYPHA
MQEIQKSRKRSANFSTKEEACLVGLAKCWLNIANEFNATVGGDIHHTAEVLKKNMIILKIRQKKHADEKCYMRGTRGGPTKITKFDPIESEVIEILGPHVEGLLSEFGGDANNVTDSIQASGTDNDILLQVVQNGSPCI